VPDLGQVPQLDPRVVTAGLEAVVAGVEGDRVEGEEQVRLAGLAGGQPPGAVSAGWAVVAGGGEGESWRWAAVGSAGRVMVAGRDGSVSLGGAFAVLGCGPGAAVAYRVSLLVGDGYAVSGLGVGGGSVDQLSGQGRVDRAQAGDLAGPVGQAQQGGQGDGEVDAADEPGREHAGGRRDPCLAGVRRR